MSTNPAPRSLRRAPRALSAATLGLSVASLLACSGIENPFGDDKDGKSGDAKVIERPPDPLDLYVTNATINMITLKNGETEVPAKFGGVTGQLSFDDGDKQQDLSGSLTLDLSSWDSGLGVRDERVQTLFFQVEDNPTATFSLDRIEGLPEEGLAVGHEAEGTAFGKLYLASANIDVEAPVKLSRTGPGEFHIDTTEQFEVSIESLGLTGPLKELMRVCEHESIGDGVKVGARIDLSTQPPPEPEADDGDDAEDGDEADEDEAARIRRRLDRPNMRAKVRSGSRERSKSKGKQGRR